MTILPAVIFDDIEAWSVAKIDAALAARSEPYADDVLVATQVPATRRDRMVIVRRDGGGQLDVVREAPRLGIRVFGSDELEASNLARLVSALLWSAPDGNPVSKVTLTGGPYGVADESNQPLYYFTAELVSHGRNLT